MRRIIARTPATCKVLETRSPRHSGWHLWQSGARSPGPAVSGVNRGRKCLVVITLPLTPARLRAWYPFCSALRHGAPVGTTACAYQPGPIDGRHLACVAAGDAARAGVLGLPGLDRWGEERDPTQSIVHYEERWATERATETRVRSDAFTKLLEVLEASADVPRVEFDFVSRRQGLEYVEEVRRAKH
jgi:hypothetical protein